MSASEMQGPGASAIWLELSDAELLDQCSVDTYRASGPGGQKRNKTSSAIRLRHQPTGLIVTAVESRSQHENRARAVRRLRQAIALEQRSDLLEDSDPPGCVRSALERDPTLRVNPKHPDYWPIVKYLLDVFWSNRARAADTAARLNLSTGHLNRFLKSHPKLWEKVNEMRRAFGHAPLR